MTPLLLAPLLVGAVLAVALSVNAQLGKRLSSPLTGGLVSFSVGSTALLLAWLAFGLRPEAGALAAVPPLLWTGGPLGAFFLVATIFFLPRLGAAATAGLQIAGQMLSSAVMDQYGLLGVPLDPVSVTGTLGVVLALLGIAVASRASRRSGPGGGGGAVLPAAAFATGLAIPLQAAVNGGLERAIDSILLTGTISFLTGTALLLALFLAGRALGRVRPTPADLKGAPWWIWIGGLCASVFVTGTFVLVQRLGAAPAIGLAVGGQQVASLVIDRFGLFGLPRRNLTPGRVGGVAALLLGVALVEAG
ncbi:MAG: DMT family transporter [Geminicoccaceae bacterium]|nr:DMT family transporter [Geminicoccaceae bacterium]